ncbi:MULTISPECIES: translation initiation factor 2 [Lysinibacillus]|uniref:translation initiation factor 2 n=1 Tax=Lysinibacillus TaxID=400634 RepID=UPI001C8B2555|nr:MULTISPECIES: translation initiation factor 2 [Lysinibacillus]WHP42863.1 translation initiation factor 2 [Lysinibacillus boronitolerans]MBX8945492.1 translation initiation factor 2 [Lysinibacillus sp. K60]UNT53455.1 translation initiation factor 2 [Lysinibacillus capsici]UUV26813.1 translation initiation factor 2 [Lysinibacillus sp. FN11]UYB49698.1 translation initiation factor 2 [Lysinibacillus capsici]
MGRNNKPSQGNESIEIYAAKLAYIGTAISTLGDGLQTIAAGLALEALQNANNDSSQPNNGNGNGNQTVKIDNMQKQIDYLIAELKEIKKMLK